MNGAREQALGTLVVLGALAVFVLAVAWGLAPYLAAALTLPVGR